MDPKCIENIGKDSDGDSTTDGDGIEENGDEDVSDDDK